MRRHLIKVLGLNKMVLLLVVVVLISDRIALRAAGLRIVIWHHLLKWRRSMLKLLPLGS